MFRLSALVVVLGMSSTLLTGCAGPGQSIADRIRAANSPIVREVVLSPANFWEGSGDAVYVYLKEEATEAEALDLWCRVVLPAGAKDLPTGAVGLWKGGASSGALLALHNPTCPG
jgi:hypothetical protein